MMTRKTLEQAKTKKGNLGAQKFDSFSGADVERIIAKNPDLAPPHQSLTPLLAA